MRKKEKEKKNEAKANTRLGSSYVRQSTCPQRFTSTYRALVWLNRTILTLYLLLRGERGELELVARDWLFLNSRLNDRNA